MCGIVHEPPMSTRLCSAFGHCGKSSELNTYQWPTPSRTEFTCFNKHRCHRCHLSHQTPLPPVPSNTAATCPIKHRCRRCHLSHQSPLPSLPPTPSITAATAATCPIKHCCHPSHQAPLPPGPTLHRFHLFRQNTAATCPTLSPHAVVPVHPGTAAACATKRRCFLFRSVPHLHCCPCPSPEPLPVLVLLGTPFREHGTAVRAAEADSRGAMQDSRSHASG